MDLNNFIIYEQPGNELMRGCLRLSYLFKQIDACLQNGELINTTPTIIQYLVDILNLLDRPDLKSKLAKEFHRHVIFFSRLAQSPDVDHKALNHTLDQLKEFLDYFLNTPGKIAHPLREDPFILQIRQHFMYPGDCTIDSPIYVYWLNQHPELHEEQIIDWLDRLNKIRIAVELLLHIARDSSEMREVIAEQGFYHETLSPTFPCQLIRVGLARNELLFPEISVGKPRATVRFMTAELNGDAKQTTGDIPFYLACCSI